MDLIKETQEAHDNFVRAIQHAALSEEAKLKVIIGEALEAFHTVARKVDAFIQTELHAKLNQNIPALPPVECIVVVEAPPVEDVPVNASEK